jgi:hypothetical protein
MTKTNNPQHRLLSDAPPLEFRPEPAAPPLVTAWTMTKKGHRAVCTIHAHPLGVEVRLDLDDELHRSEVIRCATPVRELPEGCADICCGLAEQMDCERVQPAGADSSR